MTVKDDYRDMYQVGKTPWDIGQPDFNLIETVTQTPIPPGKALEVGCGSGDNSIWLAQNRFQVVATDTSEIAIAKAKEKACQAKVECSFLLVDFLENKIEGAPFGFVFDRGCFHSFASPDDRNKFARNVAAHLDQTGLWLTLVGNADEHRQHPGPPQRTAGEIIAAVEPHFEVLSLRSTQFGSQSPHPPRAWRCLMRKRQDV